MPDLFSQQFVYTSGFADLVGQPVRICFKPTPRHRNWQTSAYRFEAATPAVFERAVTLQKIHGWAAIRFVPAAPPPTADDVRLEEMAWALGYGDYQEWRATRPAGDTGSIEDAYRALRAAA